MSGAGAEGAPSHSDHIQDRVGDGGFSFAGDEKCFAADVSPPAANFAFGDREVDLVDTVVSRFLSDDALWSDQHLTPNHSTISQAIDSPSSLCGSTISADKPECEYYHPWGATATSGYSSHEPSLGLCDRGESDEDPSVLMKRLRRAEGNRAAAKRSRMKRQAHQQKLELEVEHLGQSKAALWKQLENVSRQFRDSVTIYRVLRSDVDAMRAEVKLAEDRIAGSSLMTSNFNHQLQLQSRHSTSPHLLNPLNNTCPVLPNVSPTVAAHGDDDAFYTRMAVSGLSAAFTGPH